MFSRARGCPEKTLKYFHETLKENNYKEQGELPQHQADHHSEGSDGKLERMEFCCLQRAKNACKENVQDPPRRFFFSLLSVYDFNSILSSIPHQGNTTPARDPYAFLIFFFCAVFGAHPIVHRVETTSWPHPRSCVLCPKVPAPLPVNSDKSVLDFPKWKC